MNESNRKVKMTNSMLSKALFELLETKDLESISSSELIKMSYVGKSTFYNHYKCPTDLMEKLSDDYISSLQVCFKTMGIDLKKGFGMLTAIIKLKKSENLYFFRYIPFQIRMIKKLEDTIKSIEKNDLVALYKASGIFFSLKRWIEAGYESNIDAIGETL